jgi:hypothetical protein
LRSGYISRDVVHFDLLRNRLGVTVHGRPLKWAIVTGVYGCATIEQKTNCLHVAVERRPTQCGIVVCVNIGSVPQESRNRQITHSLKHVLETIHFRKPLTPKF